jgi:hypothetical protein
LKNIGYGKNGDLPIFAVLGRNPVDLFANAFDAVSTVPGVFHVGERLGIVVSEVFQLLGRFAL